MDPHLFEAVPDALLIVGPDGRIARANGNAYAMFGRAPGTLENEDVDALLPVELRDRHREHRAHYLRDPHVRPMGASGQVLVGERSNGTRFPVEIALSPLTHGGRPAVLASIRDITDTQRQRQALARARYDAIAAQVGQLAIELGGPALFDGLVDLLARSLDAEDAAIALLPAGEEIARIQACAARQWWPPGMEIVLPEPAGGASGAPIVHAPGQIPPSMRAAASPGHAGNAALVMVPLQDARGWIGALLVAARAETLDADALHLLHATGQLLSTLLRQRRAEEALAHAQRLDALGQLTGGIAHDFNNLLTVLSGSLQLLRPHVQAREGWDLIDSAARSVERGTQLTRKLLAFARRQRLLPRAVDVAQLLEDLERMLARTLGDRIVFRATASPDVPAAYVDPGQAEAALLNLVLNARDALADGGSIEVVAGPFELGPAQATDELAAGRYVRIVVSDTGRGMPAATLARAMGPFFTTKESGRGSGLGLGLSMVYGFARQSGGGLQIESMPGHGTRVALFLPAALAPSPAPEPPVPAATPSAGERILVVEDDPDVRRIAVAFLRSAGYEVRAVATAEAALAMLAAEPFALLFSDVMLGPGMDGQVAALAARRAHPRLAVLLATGYEAPLGDAPTAFELISKPYDRDALLARVRNLLDAAR